MKAYNLSLEAKKLEFLSIFINAPSMKATANNFLEIRDTALCFYLVSISGKFCDETRLSLGILH